jgi:Asp-tRNA(Asn)/Glu-tRNA(Gln) amidotransferase B subunit
LDGLENEVEKSGDPKIEEQFQELTNQRDELIKMEQSSRDTESSSGGTSLMTEKEKAERLKLLKTLLSETELLMNELEHK